MLGARRIWEDLRKGASPDLIVAEQDELLAGMEAAFRALKRLTKASAAFQVCCWLIIHAASSTVFAHLPYWPPTARCSVLLEPTESRFSCMRAACWEVWRRGLRPAACLFPAGGPCWLQQGVEVPWADSDLHARLRRRSLWTRTSSSWTRPRPQRPSPPRAPPPTLPWCVSLILT
jgi:hypothetical protein